MSKSNFILFLSLEWLILHYLTDKPDIVIGTPMRILAHLNEGNLDVKESLKMLVIDEADLMFAFDHVKEIQEILK